MAKKRPRAIPAPFAQTAVPAKDQPEYWLRRLFKNTFTYKGQRKAVSFWSVKIQHLGRRKCFSLKAGDPREASIEACAIYKKILSEGWTAINGRAHGMVSENARSDTSSNNDSIVSEASLQPFRLVHRKYPLSLNPATPPDFSALIAWQGIKYYFPLGTADADDARSRARQMHDEIVRNGWNAALQIFPRELTLAFRWLDDPVVWTYTTLHTRPGNFSGHTDSTSNEVEVIIIDADSGIRVTLAHWVNQQAGFRCTKTFANSSDAHLEKTSADLVLFNQPLPDSPEELETFAPESLSDAPVVVLYSAFEDSGQLFKATPSGAAGYMLKRTAPERIFDPIAGLQPAVSRDQIISRVREYFQRLSALLPHGHASQEMAKLTPRELEILALLSKGELAKKIADRLGISIWTVQGHIKSIFEKLNVHSRTEAVVKYLQK